MFSEKSFALLFLTNRKNRDPKCVFNVQGIKVSDLIADLKERTTPSVEAAASPPFPGRGAFRVQCSSDKSSEFEVNFKNWNHESTQI
jgi:hypothetical protein